jgi:hypothetical protein
MPLRHYAWLHECDSLVSQEPHTVCLQGKYNKATEGELHMPMHHSKSSTAPQLGTLPHVASAPLSSSKKFNRGLGLPLCKRLPSRLASPCKCHAHACTLMWPLVPCAICYHTSRTRLHHAGRQYICHHQPVCRYGRYVYLRSVLSMCAGMAWGPDQVLINSS